MAKEKLKPIKKIRFGKIFITLFEGGLIETQEGWKSPVRSQLVSISLDDNTWFGPWLQLSKSFDGGLVDTGVGAHLRHNSNSTSRKGHLKLKLVTKLSARDLEFNKPTSDEVEECKDFVSRAVHLIPSYPDSAVVNGPSPHDANVTPNPAQLSDTNQANAQQASLTRQISELFSLMESGVLTQAEFEAAKAKLLS